MTPSALATEPACPEAPNAPESNRGDLRDRTAAARGEAPRLRIEARSLSDIPRETWDGFAAANPFATPFSAWAFHRAWWDAYGDNAHEQTLVAVAANAPARAEPVAILPLMHRHEVEDTDAARHTTLRHEPGAALTPVPPSAKAIFFGASYHADYATLLAAPADMPAVAEALMGHLAEAARPGGAEMPWDVIDLRRLRCDDPVADALAAAVSRREIAEGWTLNLEREDVCPVATLPAGGTIDDYLATLGKKDRHEIRRKVRRAEDAGEVLLEESREPLADLEAFIDLHQAKWGEDGLFPATEGGAQSRVMFRRLFEGFGTDGPLRLSFLTVGGRRVAAGVHFEMPDRILYYNAGVDPDARDLSPGVVMVERLVERAIERGKTALDFLRGDEPYKYSWGAVDEPIQRLLVRRRVG
ncbi:MAG: GNAT family N-acetyltransferase [Chloroflexi bacterium]|nr:GNAT family N-acetyltransferase [Chloroflexota bacterium]